MDTRAVDTCPHLVKGAVRSRPWSRESPVGSSLMRRDGGDGQKPLARGWGRFHEGSVCESGEEPEAASVVFSPAGLLLNHAVACCAREGIVGVMK
jgi:hypothetical protein